MASIHDRESIWQMVEKRLKNGHKELDSKIQDIYDKDHVKQPEAVQTQLEKAQRELLKLVDMLDKKAFYVSVSTLRPGDSQIHLSIVELDRAKQERLEPRVSPLRAKHELLNKFGDHMREQIILCSSGAELRSWFEDTIKELRKL